MEDDLIEDIAVELESTSFWRDQKAAEFPDEERNEGASQLLQRLAHEVRAMAGSDLAVELQKANEKLRDVSADFNELITEEGQYRSRIGFDHFPSNGSEYLEHLLDLCREYIATSERRSSDANEPSVRPPPPSRQPPPGWTAGVDDATNQIIQQTHAHQRRAHIAATANAPGVIGPPPAPPEPPLDATSGAEPPKIVQLEGRATMMMSGAASMRTDATVPASITPTGVGSEGASPRPGTDEPPIDSIPQQVTAASQFTLDAAGRIDLVPDPPDNALLADARLRELYEDMRYKALALSELGHNQLGDLSAPIDRFRAALPESIESVSVTRLWSRGNTLRRRFHAHETVVRSVEPDLAHLPPLVAEKLGDLVDTFNIFIVGDPKGRELDQIRLGPQERHAAQAIVDAALPIVEAVRESEGLATPAAVEALTEQVEAARVAPAGIDGDQVLDLSRRTTGNFLLEVLRFAYTGVRAELGFAWKEYRAGGYRELGKKTVQGITGVGIIYFVVHNAETLKAFVEQAFHNPALIHIIDVISQTVSSLTL